MRICAIAHMYLWGFVLGAHTAELDALLEELYEMTGSGGDEGARSLGRNSGEKAECVRRGIPEISRRNESGQRRQRSGHQSLPLRHLFRR